ncbi:hypothetical protein ACWD6I_32230 [Streptomyces sp. NPDC002454]
MLTGSAACGTMENLSAAQKLDRAFDDLGKEKTLSFELGLDTDAASLRALDADAAPGEKIPDEAVDALTSGRITVSLASKKPFAESKEKDFTGQAVKISTADGDLIEFRTVGDHAYGRVDVEAISARAGTPAPSLDELTGGGEVPAELKPMEKLFKGEWVKVSTKELEEIGQEAPVPGGSAGMPDFSAATQKKLVTAVRNVLTDQVEFETTKEDGDTERITATASLRDLATALVDEVRPFFKDLKLPADAKLPTAKELKEVPAKKGSAEFTLKNGDLSELSFDLTQLDKKLKGKKLGIALRVVDGEAPTAPANATELKLDGLMGGGFGPGEAPTEMS